MGFYAILAAGALCAVGLSLWLLAHRSRPGTRTQRRAWWSAGVVIPSALTFGAAIVAELNDSIRDVYLVGGGFLAALAVLLIGAVVTRDKAAWWLGNAVPAAVWVVFAVMVILAFRSLGD